jgi:spoIIIJ-associated protein
MSPSSSATPEAAEALQELLERVRDALGLRADVEVAHAEGSLTGTLEGENLGLFIGRHGATIDAVQHLAQRIVLPPRLDPPVRVVVDAEGYRGRREEGLRRQADEAVEETLRFDRPAALDAMSAAERKVVHQYLADRDDVQTHSEGDEPERHLVVTRTGTAPG